MQFEVGQIVIHPHHGPAKVTNIVTRNVKGEPTDYAELEVQGNKLNVSFPIKNADEIGIRDIANDNQIDKITEVLVAPTVNEEKQWSRRYKANRAAMATGDPLQLAAVVRDLVRRREGGSLSLGERDLLKEAAAPLIAEIALSVDIDEEKAQEVMFSLIMDESTAAIDALKDKKQAKDGDKGTKAKKAEPKKEESKKANSEKEEPKKANSEKEEPKKEETTSKTAKTKSTTAKQKK